MKPAIQSSTAIIIIHALSINRRFHLVLAVDGKTFELVEGYTHNGYNQYRICFVLLKVNRYGLVIFEKLEEYSYHTARLIKKHNSDTAIAFTDELNTVSECRRHEVTVFASERTLPDINWCL